MTKEPVETARARLRATWDHKTGRIEFHQDLEGSDAALLRHALEKRVLFRGDGRSLIEELEHRGYDLTTLKFSIRRKAG